MRYHVYYYYILVIVIFILMVLIIIHHSYFSYYYFYSPGSYPPPPPTLSSCDPSTQEHWSSEVVVYPRPDSLGIYCVYSEHLAQYSQPWRKTDLRIVRHHFCKTSAAKGCFDRGNNLYVILVHQQSRDKLF